MNANKDFELLPIDNAFKKALKRCGYEELTEIQSLVIPEALNNNDLIAQAPTGTGKTCAFGIPALQKIDINNNVQVLILSPTRELALQITEDLREYSFYKEGIRIVTLYGGEEINIQINALKKRPQVIVATPGRLMDHMRRHTVKLNDVSLVVLDEADEMLNMGFREDINLILDNIHSLEHQTMLFSATFSDEIRTITNDYLVNPINISVNHGGLTVKNVTQKYIVVREQDKVEVLSRLIDINNFQLVMIFCNTKKAVDEVTSGLLQRGFVVEGMHGDMKQVQRERVISRFKNRQINILVASDVAARGLDIEDVDVVFNYDLPQDEEYYVHRVGRTGRAKKLGLSISLVEKQEVRQLRNIINYTKAEISPLEIPDLNSVIKSRINRIVLGAELEAKNQENSKYFKLVKNAIIELASKNVSAEEIIAGLILLQMNINNDNEIVLQSNNIELARTNSSGKKDITRFFINLGRKDKLKVFNLTDYIVSKTGLPNKVIDKVDLHEEFSFFEVPKKYENLIIQTFNRKDKKFNKKVIVEESHPKEKKGTGKRRGGVGRKR